jgi:DNA transformation protein
MSADEGVLAWMEEALEPLGVLSKRPMMGAATLYLDNVVFAIVDGSDIYFKADTVTDALWDEAGCARFTIEMNGKTGTMNYRRAPDDVHDDADAMRHWARLALEAGLRATAKRKPKRKKPPEVSDPRRLLP